ncbi:MAG: cupin domain-containing protein [Planctomycetota bacterium]
MAGNDLEKSVHLREKLGLFEKTWTPHIIAELNGQRVKLAKLRGELCWHSHADEDELFFVVEGSLTMQMRDGSREWSVEIGPGELFVVPRGLEHNPVSPGGASVMLFEPAETRHTGEVEHERTVREQGWV